MSVKRWVIVDPNDSNATTNTYVFPRNPASMTSVYSARSVSNLTTTSGKILVYEGTRPAKQWSFSGPILDKQQFTDLNLWVYGKKRRLNLTDHFGRTLELVFTELDVVPKRRVNYYWSHDYTISAIVTKITGLTVGALGPT